MDVADFPLLISANVTHDQTFFRQAAAASKTPPAARESVVVNKLTKVLDTVNRGLAAGQIFNPVYQDAKFTGNNLVETAFRQTIGAFTYSGAYLNLPPDVRKFEIDFGFVSLHTVAGKLKRVDACTLQHPLIDALRALLNEVAPLAEAFATLKEKVVKRQPKPVEDRRAKYDAPSASHTAIGRVKALLEQITEGSRDKLAANFIARDTKKLAQYMEAQQAANDQGKGLSPHSHFCPRDSQHPNSGAAEMVERLTTGKYENSLRGMDTSRYVLKPNHEALIQQAAFKMADDIRLDFVYKNLAKLDSIVDAKGDLVDGKILGREISLDGLRGTLRFTFADGAAFTVINSVVWSRSVYGKAFNRFPLTFHDVVLAGGKKMGSPSEKRMNTIFVGKEA